MKAPARGARVCLVISFMVETGEIPSSAVSLNMRSALLRCRPAAPQAPQRRQRSGQSNCNRTCHGSALSAPDPDAAQSRACHKATKDAPLKSPNVDTCHRNIQRDRDTNRRKRLQ